MKSKLEKFCSFDFAPARLESPFLPVGSLYESLGHFRYGNFLAAALSSGWCSGERSLMSRAELFPGHLLLLMKSTTVGAGAGRYCNAAQT